MRTYAALLHLLPSSFRAEYGGEMAAIFERRRRDARGAVAIAALWAAALADIVGSAARLHADILGQDLKYTARVLARAPGFTLTVIVVCALGIGATTAAFSITNHVLLRPLPFARASQLVRLWEDQTFRGYSRMELSPANYRDWKAMSASFESMAAYTGRSANLLAGDNPERLDGATATADLFGVLGVRAALGRAFSPTDGDEGAAPIVVLSDRLWKMSFGADAAVVGRSVILNDEPYEIAGVMPADFHFPDRDVQFWIPMRFQPRDFQDRHNNYLRVVARLRTGISLEQARAEMRIVAARVAQAYPGDTDPVGATVVRLRDEVSPQARLLLLALLAASGCVLLVAVVNLANLLLARALTRRRELAVRTAIGAAPERLVRQMLTESLLLAAIGGGAGVLVAYVAGPLAAQLVPTSLPISEIPRIDVRVLLFAAAVTATTGVVFGIVPALRGRREGVSAALREDTRTGTSHRTEHLRSLLVVAEVAACTVLLVSSGLLLRAMWRIQQTDPGFRSDRVLTLRTALPMPKYAQTDRRMQFYTQVISEIEAIPGVSSAAYISFLPMAMRGGVWPIVVSGRAPDQMQSDTASLRFVTPRFFKTLGIPVKGGRDVSDSDTRSSRFVAVVSESFARRYWPGPDPLGQRFTVAFSERTIVGIVGDVRVRGLERVSEPQVYLPAPQVADGAVPFYTPKDLVIKTSGSPSTLLAAVRQIVARADPHQPISDVRTLSDIVDADTAPRAAQVQALAAFAAIGVLLAALGIHGLLAFTVSQRFREIGVRIALGARTTSILGMVVRRALALTGVGLGCGLLLGYAAARGMQALLAGVSPADFGTFAAAVILSLVMTLIGSALPAIRATRIDPLIAMRVE